jgi:serine/threonine-protein phosphatase 6 regulatory subunit 3
MSLLNRSPNMDNLYDSEGRLQGGLSALEELGQVISSNTGSIRSPEALNGTNDEMEPALELPISHTHHDSSSIDSDDDMSEAGSSDNDVMEEIVMYDEPHAQLELSPICSETALPPLQFTVPSSPNTTSMPSPTEIAARGVALSRVGPHSDVDRHIRSHSTSRRSSRRTTTNGDASLNLPLPIGDKLKRGFLEIDIASTLLVSNLIKHNIHDLSSISKDLFFEFPWNNFLHSAVYDYVHQILTGNVEDSCNRELAIALFRDALLMHRIVEGQKRNDLES